MPALENTTYATAVEQGASPGSSVLWSDGNSIPRDWLHPEWRKREQDWRLFRLCYVGGREFIESTSPVTLYSHTREDQPSYDWRRRRASYRNHCEAIVGMIADAIFQPQVLRAQLESPPEGDPAPEPEKKKPEDEPPRIKRAQKDDPAFEPFLKDVDGKGTNADPFWNEVERWASVYGRYWVGIAMPSAPELEARAKKERRLVSVKEAKEEGIRPFLYAVPPSSVIDWQRDERGRLEHVVMLSREERRVPLPKQGANQHEKQAQPKVKLIARVLYRDSEERFEVGPRGGLTPLGVTLHPFGEVPLVPVEIRADGRSMLEDIARLMVEVYNLDSMVTEQAFRQTFNQLVAKVAKKDDFQNNVSGTDSLLVIQPGDDLTYLAPNAATIETLSTIADGKIAEAYAMAHLRSRPGGKGSQPAVDVSGVAYAFEHKHAENALAGIAVRLEEAELKILGMRARALGLDPAGALCQYPREFDVRALLSRANEAQQLKAAGLPPAAMAEVLKQLVRRACPRLPAGKLAEIDEAIEKQAEQAAEQREALVEATGAKPAPPNQGRQPPGRGAGEDRLDRALSAPAPPEKPKGKPDPLAGKTRIGRAA